MTSNTQRDLAVSWLGCVCTSLSLDWEGQCTEHLDYLGSIQTYLHSD